uniref:Family with sequence similarity 13 member A n=1 Tax=Salarias fasciatus TaxID=181472 RepID=A0A672HRI0_SALFA
METKAQTHQRASQQGPCPDIIPLRARAVLIARGLSGVSSRLFSSDIIIASGDRGSQGMSPEREKGGSGRVGATYTQFENNNNICGSQSPRARFFFFSPSLSLPFLLPQSMRSANLHHREIKLAGTDEAVLCLQDERSCCFDAFKPNDLFEITQAKVLVINSQILNASLPALLFLAEPVPAYPLQRESMDREEARLSPHAGGRLIRQLVEEDSDPMVSPRFYAYGQCQQYLDDTEVPPSPPNAHSFISRRRSSSLGSCDDEKEELTSAQLTKRIHILKKKIHRFEEKFEEERKYRPSHSDKAANPEVLRWVNELARLRKELKEQKLLKSEEDLPPLTRQRSNTLPKSFGSQLEKKPQQEKVPKPPVDSTLEAILKKLQEKREEVHRPEDIKDMTREQIAAEKVALQKALLHYESIHGRPVTKSERQIMKPLYDRYRLVKQILCRASTIPVIGSPSSKRRGPLLQPIIEGETALFFDDIKEEEDGSEDDGDAKTQFTVTVRPDLSVLSFLEHMDEEGDGFISPVDELSPSKNALDMRLSNLHSATTQELVEQLQEAREEKKRIRKNLKEFEDQFLRQNGRNVQKEDRSPLAVEYNEYKHIKAKLRLLEVLISKRDSTKFI